MSRPIPDHDPYLGIAHPVRRRILDLLRKGPMPSGELHSHFHMSWPTLSHHLTVLRQAGLVTQQREGRRRVYKVDSKRLRTITSWLRSHDGSATTQRTAAARR